MTNERDMQAEIVEVRTELEAQRLHNQADPDTLTARMIRLAKKLKANGESVECEALFREALDVRRRLYTADVRVGVAASYLGRFLEETDHRDEAEPLYREALEIFRKNLPASHPHVLLSLRNLASVLDELKGDTRLNESESLMREALELSRVNAVANPLELAGCLSDLGAHLSDRLLLDEAEQLLNEAMQIFRRDSGVADEELSYTLARCARLRLAQNRPGEAEPLAREALTLREKQHPPTDHRVAKAKSLLGLCLIRLKRFDEANQLLTTALDVLEGRPCAAGAGPSRIQDTRDRLSELRTEWRACRPTLERNSGHKGK